MLVLIGRLVELRVEAHLAAMPGPVRQEHLQGGQEMLNPRFTDPPLLFVGKFVVGVLGQAQPPLAIVNDEILERVGVLLEEVLQLALPFANHRVVEVRVRPTAAAEDVLDLLKWNAAYGAERKAPNPDLGWGLRNTKSEMESSENHCYPMPPMQRHVQATVTASNRFVTLPTAFLTTPGAPCWTPSPSKASL